jgi:hypothetical protein
MNDLTKIKCQQMNYLLPKKVNQDKEVYAAFKDIDYTIL